MHIPSGNFREVIMSNKDVSMIPVYENHFVTTGATPRHEAIVVCREYGINPLDDAPFRGSWVMRYRETGKFIDCSRDIDDLAKKYNLTIHKPTIELYTSTYIGQ